MKVDDITKAEEKVNNEDNQRRRKNKEIKENRDCDFLEVAKRISKQYPDGIKEDYILHQGIKKIYPFACSYCANVLIFPYDFLTKKNIDNGFNRCRACMTEETERTKKYKDIKNIICDCGIKYLGTDNNIISHIEGDQHKRRINRIIDGTRYSKVKLIELCKNHKIPYYKKLNMEEMIEAIRRIK